MKRLRRVLLIAHIVVLSFPAFPQPVKNVDFFGVVSSDADDNMIQMTENLYFTQLGEVAGISVVDKRKSGFIASYKSAGEPDLSFASSPFAFYAVIQRASGDKWDCVLHIADIRTHNIHATTKTYDSYYKILMESKSSLQAVFSDLFKPQGAPNIPPPPKTSSGTSTEEIAGTWSGEDYIDKIVILRGGRGFIIFKNGATMNIAVVVSGTSVTVTQAGKSNASFFPDLPRQIALQAATTAKPIIWNLSMQNDNMMSGTKTTLVQSDDGTAQGSVPVTWKKL
ncbi:MAG: hypothetical protein IJR50_02685 [Treponema sp.]|nr:hypothetical protein [Treponema sp.]